MINRILIRIKTVQLLYSYLLLEKHFMIESQPTPPTKEKRFAYSLYLDTLDLIIRIARGVEKRGGEKPLYDNSFIRNLTSDDKIRSLTAQYDADTSPFTPALPSLIEKVKESGIYKNFLKHRKADHNLALSLTLKLKEEGRLLPRGLVLMSPWTDLTSSGKSHETRSEIDPVLNAAYLEEMIRNYAEGQELKDPLISPLFGDYEGFPPTYIQVGDNEILLDDSAMLYQKLLHANVSVKLDIFKGMWHVFQMSPFKTAYEAMDKNAEFIYDICR